MSTPLHNPTDDPAVNHLLQMLIDRLRHFDARVLVVYLTGSYHNQDAIPTSEIDVVVVFSGALRPGEEERIQGLGRALTTQTSRRLDLSLYFEEPLLESGATGLKVASRLLYGEDIRPRLSLDPIERYQR